MSAKSEFAWHSLGVDEVLKKLETKETGLSRKEARSRLEKYGPNEIKQQGKKSIVKLIVSQFNNFLIYILFFAVILSMVIGEIVDSVVILIILVLIGLIGFVQEYRAEKAIEALKKLASLEAKVLRDGKEQMIDVAKLVPGDVILLETGDKVPADARIITSHNLSTSESALTGESLPVVKIEEVFALKTAVADRKNIIFSNTIVTNGRAEAVVVETGMTTQIGNIAKLLQKTEIEQTPLQKKLYKLGKKIGYLVLLVCGVVFVAGILKGIKALEMLETAVSLAVAAVPEGLPAVVIVTLAIGAKKMVRKNALVRRLPSVESLGETTVICTDKTGTLTKNEMTVKKIFVDEHVFDVTGAGYNSKGHFEKDAQKIDPKKYEDLNLLLQIGLLNNNAKINNGKVIGDPTEAALIISSEKAGFSQTKLEKQKPRIDEIEFTSNRKIMTTVHESGEEKVAYMKGAPEIVLAHCTKIIENGQISKLSKVKKEEILAVNTTFANQALRVLGFAYRKINGVTSEEEMIFVGLQAMIDPPREAVKNSIAKCRKAGIRVIMITGDHGLTATAIAHQVGIKGKSLTGEQLDRMKSFDKIIDDVDIYSRVNPEHKLKLVETLKKQGHIVAMTGDGVNDAPALKKADIGIAMGIVGTDVAKESAEMILLDDNFTSIVNAIEEGRGIYNNIKKFVVYLLSSNLGEVLTIFLAILLLSNSHGEALLPIVAIQILWINLVTDGLPALALSVDPFSPNMMKEKPRNPKESIITRSLTMKMGFIGIIMTIGTLAVFTSYQPNENLLYAQTMAFTTLMLFQMFNVLNCRSESRSLFQVGLLSNKFLILAILISMLLQLTVLYTPLGTLFNSTPLSLIDLLISFAVASSVLWLMEIYKVFIRIKQN
jgi:P-type Ca2+ transporter type 2C